jgi:hypothetical protein
MSTILNEAMFAEGLGDMVKNGVANAADRVRWAFKDDKARGRLGLRAATKHIYKDWNAYIGRKQLAGSGAKNTLGNLAQFLEFQYGIEIGQDVLDRIAGAQAAPEAEPQGGNTADGRAKAAIGQMSQSEIDALRKKKTESINESAETTFDPRKLFPRLADVLIDHGLMAVSRNGEVMGGNRRSPASSKSEPANPDGSAPADPNSMSSKITSDGHSIDAKKMSELLEQDRVTKEQMDELRTILQLGQNALAGRVRRNAKIAALIASVVNATLKSISSDNDPAKVISSNITASGNTISISKMKELLEKDGISGSKMNAVRSELDAGGEGAISKILQNGGDGAKTVIAITNAVINATTNVGAKKRPVGRPAAAAAAPAAEPTA